MLRIKYWKKSKCISVNQKDYILELFLKFGMYSKAKSASTPMEVNAKLNWQSKYWCTLSAIIRIFNVFSCKFKTWSCLLCKTNFLNQFNVARTDQGTYRNGFRSKLFNYFLYFYCVFWEKRNNFDRNPFFVS